VKKKERKNGLNDSHPIDYQYVLDSYAFMALFNDEPGAARVETLLRQAEEGEVILSMSLINLGELAYIIERRRGVHGLGDILAYLKETPVKMVAVSQERIFAAAHIKAQNSLSFADAFAAGLAQELEATLLTGDPEFQSLEDHIIIEWLPTSP
jgi:ribonuclease VapC